MFADKFLFTDGDFYQEKIVSKLTGQLMQNKRQFTVNAIATAFNLIIQFSINFFLTSYLVRTIGSTAFGFWGLANNVINYALIVTAALNSMSSRYIGIEYHKGNMQKATAYYSSVFMADLLFALVILLPCCILIGNIEKIISVPPELIADVKTVFYIVFINMCCNVVFAVFGCVYIIKDRIDLSSIINILSNVIKAAILIFLYWRFRPSIVYLGTATLLVTIFMVSCNVYYIKKLMPEVKLSSKHASISSVKPIVSSGIWNSVNQLSIMLLHGLDLLIANLFVSSAAMGLLSVAGTIPSVIVTCVFSLAALFSPRLLELYSRENFNEMFGELKNSIKFLTVIMCAPISFLIAFGMAFYRLWLPTADTRMVYYLSIFIILPFFSGGSIITTNYIYTVADKVKWQAIALLITGIINVGMVFLLFKVTNLGVFAVVVTSAVIGLFRNFFINAPLGAYCIKQKLTSLWPEMFRSYFYLFVACVIGLIIRNFVTLDSWPKLILIGGGCSMMTSLLIAHVVLTSTQRAWLRGRIKSIF